MEEKNAITRIPDSFSFALREPISRASEPGEGGGTVRVDSVTLVAPGAMLIIESYKMRMDLKKAFYNAAPYLNKMRDFIEEPKLLPADGKKEEDEFDFFDQSPVESGEHAQIYIDLSELNIFDLVDQFRVLALKGCVRIDGKKISPFQWKDLRQDDVLDMLFQFLGVFILPLVFPASAEKRKKTIGGA